MMDMNSTDMNTTANTSAGDLPEWLTQLSRSDFTRGDLPETVRVTLCILYVLIIVVGLGGNSLTTVVIVANREMRTVTNVFLVSLAISDALIAGINMPLQLQHLLYEERPMSEAACKIGPYTQGVVIVASVLTLVSLAIDRYYAIIHPLRARYVHTVTRALAVVAVIWVTSLVLLSPQLAFQRLEPLLRWQLEQDIRIVQVWVCSEYFFYRWLGIAYTLFFYAVLYLLPVAMMLATYGRIAVALWRRRPVGDSPATLRDSQRRLKEKKRIVLMLVLIVALFAVSWFPFYTVQLYLLADHDHQGGFLARTTIAILQLLGYSNCCVNPIIYCFINDRFQRNLVRTLRCRCLATHPEGMEMERWRTATPQNGIVVPRDSQGLETHAVKCTGGASPGFTAVTDMSLKTSELQSTIV